MNNAYELHIGQQEYVVLACYSQGGLELLCKTWMVVVNLRQNNEPVSMCLRGHKG